MTGKAGSTNTSTEDTFPSHTSKTTQKLVVFVVAGLCNGGEGGRQGGSQFKHRKNAHPMNMQGVAESSVQWVAMHYGTQANHCRGRALGVWRAGGDPATLHRSGNTSLKTL